MKNKITSLLLAGLLAFMVPTICQASTGVLVDCEKSPGFTKRLNASVKKLETRLKKYEPGTPPALALQSQIDQTKLRFDRYGKSNLLCGTDGLPHLIVDGRLDHAGEFMLPGVMFLYTTGWIGWAGRKYIQTVAIAAQDQAELSGRAFAGLQDVMEAVEFMVQLHDYC